MPMGIPTIEKRAFPMLVGSDWVKTPQVRTIHLPYDGTPVAEVYDADAATLDRAIAAAQKGAKAMADLTQYERAELLQHMRNLLERDAEEFARLVTLETGKTIREARTEVGRAQQTLAASADAARGLHGEVVPMEGAPGGKGRYAMTVREPLGVIGAITPFNFPLNLALHKIGPALAAGNSVVHKPSENTPLSALRLARLGMEAGVPEGAYNVSEHLRTRVNRSRFYGAIFGRSAGAEDWPSDGRKHRHGFANQPGGSGAGGELDSVGRRPSGTALDRRGTPRHGRGASRVNRCRAGRRHRLQGSIRAAGGSSSLFQA
jgi:hypothetical protein